MLFLSNIYVFYHAVAARMGIVRAQSCHVYPSVVGEMPWTEALMSCKKQMDALRREITEAGKAYLQTGSTLRAGVAGREKRRLSGGVLRSRSPTRCSSVLACVKGSLRRSAPLTQAAL